MAKRSKFNTDAERKAFFAKLGRQLKARKGDYILFHATTPTNARKIKRAGLKLGRYVDGRRPKGVYLVPVHHAQSAHRWAKSRMGDADLDISNKPTMLAVRVKGSKARQGTRWWMKELARMNTLPNRRKARMGWTQRNKKFLRRYEKEKKTDGATYNRRAWQEFVMRDPISKHRIAQLNDDDYKELLRLAKNTKRRTNG